MMKLDMKFFKEQEFLFNKTKEIKGYKHRIKPRQDRSKNYLSLYTKINKLILLTKHHTNKQNVHHKTIGKMQKKINKEL